MHKSRSANPFISNTYLLRMSLVLFFYFLIEKNVVEAQSEIFGQFRVKSTSPSPDASILSRNGNYPVALHNGIVDISIPLFEAKSGNLVIPVTLKYNMGGVRVNEISSVTGLQWSLVAGAAITRVINGLPDEGGMLLNPLCEPERPGEYFPCYLYNVSREVPSADAMRDLFQFNLPTRSGKFFFKDIPGPGAPFEMMTIPYAPIGISTADFKIFTITEKDGTSMIFGQPEYTSTSSTPAAPTAWYLTSMISADKSDTIILKYNTPVPLISAQRTTVLAERVDPAATLSSRLSYSNHGSIITHNLVTIREIQFRNGKIVFDYLNDRQDITGAPRINFIELYSKRRPGSYERIKRFNFYHSYFKSAAGQSSVVSGMLPGGSNSYNYRLRLDKIVQQGFADAMTKTLPPYIFEYENSAFPVLGSTAQDFMGYYNGAHSNNNLLFFGTGQVNGVEILSRQFGANRSIAPDFLRAGILKRIRYPGGSYSDFETEPNQISITALDTVFSFNEFAQVLTSRDRTKPEIIFTVTSEMTGGKYDCVADLSLNLFNNLTNEIPINTTLSLLDQTSGKYALILPDDNQFPSFSGNTVFYWNDQVKALNSTYKIQLIKGHTYKFSYTNTFSATADYFYASIKWKSVRSYSTVTSSKDILTGGLRIKAITNYDGTGSYLKKRYVYNKGYFNSNLFKGDAGYMAEILRTRIKRWYASDPLMPLVGNFYWYNIYGESISVPISAASGNVASYAEVEEQIVNASNQSLGKTVYQFRKAQDYVPAILPFFRIDEDWKRSQVEVKKVYRTTENGALIIAEEFFNAYTDLRIDSVRNLVSILSEDGTSPILSPYFEQCPGNIKNGNVYRWLDYFQLSVQSVLKSEKSFYYDKSGTRALKREKTFDHQIGANGNIVSTRDEASDDKRLITRFRYPGDFNLSNCDESICQSNYLSAIKAAQEKRNACEQNNYALYLSTGQSTYFTAYRNCAADFQNQLTSKTIPVLQSCRVNYLSCMGSAINVAGPADKAVLVMQRDGVRNTTLETFSGFEQNGIEYFTTGTRVEYQLNNSGFLRPYVSYALATNKPAAWNIVQSAGSNVFRESFKVHQTDRFGNIQQATSQNNLTQSCIWDYNGTFQVANIINAPIADVAYTSFETESTGNFSSISSSLRNSVDSRTGRCSYELAGGTLVKSGLNTSVTYVISLWSKNGAVVNVNKVAVSPSDVMVKDWRFTETRVSGVSSITLSGSGLIDEVRIYPAASQLKTFTYDPLIGLTSKTDENGKSEFFEYDPLGRLKVVRDNQKNITKAFQYNIKP